MKIAVVGGGASGLMAAIAAKNESNSVVIYERCSRCGRKILATGNGRCNMTNINASTANYHGKNPKFINSAVNKFWVDETLDFFKSIGIVHKVEDEGKVYPYSDQASAVLDVLRMKIEMLGVEIVTDFEVCDIIRKKKGFRLASYKGDVAEADKVIVAAGGKAAPDLGSNGSGYALLEKLGHTVTSLKPSLVQIKTDTDIVKKLKGIKFKGSAKIGNHVHSGEILFTEYGLSGPPIFSLSSVIDDNKSISLDLMCEYSEDELIAMMYERIINNPALPLESFFVGMLNKRIGQVMLKRLEIAPLSRRADSLSENDIIRICSAIKNWSFDILGTMSWNNAQVTKGGLLTSEFDSETMESKLISGIYAAGEILDIDGDCGGYNLQWAWSSGYIAGTAAGQAE